MTKTISAPTVCDVRVCELPLRICNPTCMTTFQFPAHEVLMRLGLMRLEHLHRVGDLGVVDNVGVADFSKFSEKVLRVVMRKFGVGEGLQTFDRIYETNVPTFMSILWSDEDESALIEKEVPDEAIINVRVINPFEGTVETVPIHILLLAMGWKVLESLFEQDRLIVHQNQDFDYGCIQDTITHCEIVSGYDTHAYYEWRDKISIEFGRPSFIQLDRVDY